jgi:hypothetical protein
MDAKTSLPAEYVVRPGNENDLETQLRLSRLEELNALRRRKLAWFQFNGREMPETEARIHALEISTRL